jgi:SAM-dependent methyltransferase
VSVGIGIDGGEDTAPVPVPGAGAVGLPCSAVRVVDLDRDMSDVIPTGMTPDSEYLFRRMTELSLERTLPGPGRRILDVASGVGQDALALAARGARVVAAEPSLRMTQLARIFAAAHGGEGSPAPSWVRGWSDRLPFPSGSFDAVICKGSLDHFDRPRAAIAEMARVAKGDGRVVLAVANFESLACRLGRAVDELRQRLRLRPLRARRGYDAPSDHFTRYELALMCEQAEEHLDLQSVEGISLGWGMPGWSKASARLPAALARSCLQWLDGIARSAPEWADVIVLVGSPRHSRTTSR